MKVEELMIGDLVRFQDKIHKVKGTDGDYNTILLNRLDKNSFYNAIEDKVEPIPLTPEILENNNFKRGNGKYWNIGKNQYGNTMYLNEVSYGYIVCTKCFDSDEYVYLYDCKYVHELQHLLKLCEIEKEIVL